MKTADHEMIIKEMNRRYDESASLYGISSKSVLWDDQQTQYVRFAELIKYIDLNSNNKTILDIGCGNGALYRFLNFMGFRGRYTGLDINDSLLEQARREFGKIDIRKKDIMSDQIDQTFDYVLMSGLFNVNVGQSQEWVFEFIKKMFSLSNEILAFNAISTHVDFRQKEMYYLDPMETFDYCVKNLSKRVTIAHHNLPFNFTIAVFKAENWTSIKKKA